MVLESVSKAFLPFRNGPFSPLEKKEKKKRNIIMERVRYINMECLK